MANTVALRMRESKTSGKVSLYLEIYKGYVVTEGKKRNLKDYETLEYFLYAKPKTPAQKQHNKEALKSAEAVKGQRLNDILNGKYGFKSEAKIKVNLIEYFKKLTEERFESEGNYGNWDSAMKHLINYCDVSTTFKEVTYEFVEGFRDYLLKKAKMKNKKLLYKNNY